MIIYQNNIQMQWHIRQKGLNSLFIVVWIMVGALVRPKGTTKNS